MFGSYKGAYFGSKCHFDLPYFTKFHVQYILQIMFKMVGLNVCKLYFIKLPFLL